MKTLNKKLLVPVVLLLCIAFMMSCYIGNVNQIAFAEQAEDLQNKSQGKVYCNATIDDDFADDTVLVVLANDVSTQKANARTNFSAEISTEDFSEVGCVEVENLTSYSSAIVDEEVARLSNPISTLSAETETEHKVNVNNFKKIISLKLSTPGKQNVLDAIKKLEKRKDVLSAEPNYLETFDSDVDTQSTTLTPNDPDLSMQWALNKINLPSAWSKSTGSRDVIVGVIDSGIEASHPDLTNNVNRTLSRDCSKTPIEEDNQPTDRRPIYHGAHVAGIIGAKGNNGIGIAGVCWNVQMVSLNVWDTKEQAFPVKNVIAAIDYAAANNIPILNFSGGGDSETLAEKRAIENYKGLLVCSAGNLKKNTDDEPRYPSAYNYMDNVISVGATNSNDKIWDGGSRGSNYGAKTVDLFAPGEDIYSTIPGGYTIKTGTSMATPFVTGVAALLLSRYPDMTAGVIKANILEGVQKVSALNGLCVSGGRLNADFELKYLNTAVVSKSGDKWSLRLTNPTNAPVTVIYNYTMCTESDAKNWENLTNIQTTTVAANGVRLIEIAERLFATHIAFSYISGDTRYVTYSNELNTNKTLSSGCIKVAAHDYGGLSIIGKNGTNWKVKITNVYPNVKTIQYNEKMCTLADAKGWNGLLDVKTIHLSYGSSTVVTIAENSFSSTIAVSFLSGAKRIIKYADNLSPDTTMSCHSNSLTLYLGLANAGKSGNAWKIQITNMTDEKLTVQYNSKMCTESDGKNWTGLVDLKTITLEAGETKTVIISERLFATSIAVSFAKGSYRYVSYANSLNTSGLIKVMYNTVSN